MLNKSILIVISSILGACAVQQEPPTSSLSLTINEFTQDVDRELAASGQYQGVLEQIAVDKTKLINPTYVEDQALLVPVKGAFTGTIEDLTKQIAKTTGYKVIASGEKPGAPIVMKNDITAIGLLREGYEQAKGRAEVIVNQAAKVMTIKYHRSEQSPVRNLDEREA